MFLLLSLIATTEIANADSGASGSLPSVRGLTEAEDMAVSRALGRVKTVRKAATAARSCAIATGDADTIAKADAIITRLDDAQRKLDHVATETDLKIVEATLEGVDRQLISIGAQLTALTSAIDVLPTSDEVRLIIREEIAASRAGCDANMPGDHCSHGDDEDEEDEAEEEAPAPVTPAPAASTDANGSLGFFAGIGTASDFRAPYLDVVLPGDVGWQGIGGLSWEDGNGFGTAILVRGGASFDGGTVGGEIVAYRDCGHLDVGGGVGLENQAYDIFGNSAPAANSFGGTLDGYARIGMGDHVSAVFQPYLRVGHFTASGGVDGVDVGGGIRGFLAFGGSTK